MDICVLNPFFYPYQGGTEKVLLEVYGRLAKRHNVTVLCAAPRGSPKRSVSEYENIRIVKLKTEYLDIHGLPLPFLLFGGLNGEIRKVASDLYHINNRYQYFGDNVNAIKQSTGKLALTVHNALPKNIDVMTDDMGLFYDIVWGHKLMHKCDLITGVSQNTIDTTVYKRALPKTHLVYNGVDHGKFRKIPRSDKKVRAIRGSLGLEGAIVSTNGRLVPQKGQMYLMRAIAAMRDDGVDISMFIIGRGPMEKRLYAEAERLGMKDGFRIVSNIPEDSLPYYYNASDVFAMPSLYEPAGLAILEAMACEVPSLASNIGGLPEMLDRYGVYAEPRDVEGIRRGIEGLLENPSEAARNARGGRRLVRKRNDWDSISKQYEKLFENTVRY